MQDDKQKDDSTGKEYIQEIPHQNDLEPEPIKEQPRVNIEPPVPVNIQPTANEIPNTPTEPTQPEPKRYTEQELAQLTAPPAPPEVAEYAQPDNLQSTTLPEVPVPAPPEPEVAPYGTEPIQPIQETPYAPTDPAQQLASQYQGPSGIAEGQIQSQQNSGVYTDEYEEALAIRDQASVSHRNKFLNFGLLTLFVVIMFIVGFVVTKAFDGTSTYSKHTITNSGYSYSFLFDKYAQSDVASGYNELLGYNLNEKHEIAITIFESPYSSSCSNKYTLLLVYFQFKYNGTNYPACAVSNLDTIIANFKYKGVWQYAEIYSVDGKSPVDATTAKKILDSVEVQ